VQGCATITVGSSLSDVTEKDYAHGEHVYIPLGAVHRLSNQTTSPVEIIEVQCGTYLGEDDIVRYEDVYGRV
jgi:mannose-6-phosphate isomerase-like protein (cupin superfamily)